MTAGMGRKRTGALAMAGLLLSAVAAQAEPQGSAGGDRAVVVEMFTAQGCAACPPADAIFARYSELPGVIALALHVDYWDYLGWEDSFGSPAFTERQKAYARAAQAKMIYTPQVIIGGVERLQGTQGAEIEAMLRSQAQSPAPVALQARHEGGALTIEAQALGPLGHPAQVQLVRYLPSERVSIEDGENAGHDVDYRNIVVDWRSVASWDGQAPFQLTTEVSPGISRELPLVVIVQEEGYGPVLAAARLD